MSAASPADPLWVITSYYNPAGYRRRLQNFHAFRRHLSAPLLVVELTPSGHGELRDDDADIVVRVAGDDRIWQKERLLNIGTVLLPPHVSHVAWVDADLLFSDPNWPNKARAVLDTQGGMVQLFDAAHHLPDDIDPATVTIAACNDAISVRSGISIVRSLREGLFDDIQSGVGQPGSLEKIYHVYGFGWAARRETLQAVGLYEANVIGGGDALTVIAAVGRLDQYLAKRPLTPAHQGHFRKWYSDARQAGLFAHVADLRQTAWHLWHGTMINRNYYGRRQILLRNDYDPVRDLVFEPDRALRWAQPGSALARAVGDYFFSRREDGE